MKIGSEDQVWCGGLLVLFFFGNDIKELGRGRACGKELDSSGKAKKI